MNTIVKGMLGLAAIAGLSGCVVEPYPDHVPPGHNNHYYSGGYYRDYDGDRYDDRDRYYHCPPGHHKKGWC